MLIRVQYLVVLNLPLALARLAAALVHLEEGEGEPLANPPRRQQLGLELPLVCLGNLPPPVLSVAAVAFLERTNRRRLLGPLPRLQVSSFKKKSLQSLTSHGSQVVPSRLHFQ